MPQRSNSARYLWGDRNPVDASFSYNGYGVGPHVPTVRSTYTVPTGKKANIGLLNTHITRLTAAAPVGDVYSYFRLNAAVFLMSFLLTNGVGDVQRVSVGPTMYLASGDVFDLYTADASTGGTVYYNAAARITAYDA